MLGGFDEEVVQDRDCPRMDGELGFLDPYERQRRLLQEGCQDACAPQRPVRLLRGIEPSLVAIASVTELDHLIASE